ncbi:unnamed protein product, partial [Meganyctiphanes norvegica]
TKHINMIFKVTSLLAVIGICLGDQSPYKQPGMPYDFGYGVEDEYRGVNFGANEESDGNVVRGSYTVQLPDGRTQIVTYEADHVNGYRANVEYHGEAQFPHESGPAVTFKPQTGYEKPKQPSYQPPQPSYQPPQPSYQPPQPSYQPPQPSYQPPQSSGGYQ